MTLLFANSVGCVLLSAVEVAMALTSRLHPTHQIPRTRRAVHPVSNPECLITADTCGECATYRGRASALRFICRHDAFGAGTTPAIGRSSPKDCRIWRVRRRGRPRVSARSWAWSVMLSADLPVSDCCIALASFVATIPCYAASNRVSAERASRRCECWA